MSERTVKEWGALYVARGWSIVPLVPRGKDCWHERWQERDFTPEHLDDDSNIGIKASNGLVTADEDCPEVVEVADTFLPATGAIYGRPSKPRSKRMYRCPALQKTTQFKDAGAAQKPVMLELRTGPVQDMAPPSIHPDGEQLSWDGGEPGAEAEVTLPVLLRAARLTVTCALAVRYYPAAGKRHEWTLAFAGALRKLEVTAEEAGLIIDKAAVVAHDGKATDRRTEVRTTYSKSDDDPVTGFKKLSDEAGQTFVDTLRKFWGDDQAGISSSALETMNKKHAVLFQQSGDLVVITEDSDHDGRPFLRYSNLQTIRDLYPQPVQVGVGPRGSIVKKLGQLWLDSPRRRFYRGIEMAPNGRATPDYYNLWRGFSVEPKAGSWVRFKQHVLEVIAGNDPALFSYIISWMARAVQDPGKPAYTALVLRGGMGTGKTTFAKWFGSLFGSHFLHIDNTHHLTGHFNAHLHNAILVFADEAAWPGDKAGAGALRRMVTEDTLIIERKGINALTVPNVIHLILASDADWVWPAGVDERRGVIIDVSDHRRNDRPYFAALERELLKDGGLAAMLKDLLELKITLDLREIPQTKALYEQKQLSSSAYQRWWYEELRDGDLWRESDRRPDGYHVERSAIYERYLNTIEKMMRGRVESGLPSQLGKFLRKVMPGSYPREGVRRHGGPRTWVLPSLLEARTAYEHFFRVTHEHAGWDDEQTAELEV